MSEFITIGGDIILGPDRQANIARLLQCIETLRPGGRALHIQAFPGHYDQTDPHSRRLIETGSDSTMRERFAPFLDQVATDKARGVHRQRLRVMPDLGQLVGKHQISVQELTALVQLTELPSDAGEDNRFIWLSDVLPTLRAMKNPLAQHYLQGVASGKPQGSVWAIMPHGEQAEPDITAVMVMSYKENLGHDYVRSEFIEGADLAPFVLQYVRFWSRLFDTAAVTAQQATKRIDTQAAWLL